MPRYVIFDISILAFRCIIVKTRGFRVYDLLYVQINILILRADGAEEIPSFKVIIKRNIQRSKPQKKHVRITANVIVLKIVLYVME